VDLTLVNASGEPLDMGGAFDLFDPVSAHDARGLTAEQRANRKLLRGAMEGQGFRAYRAEWWHYTLKNEPFPKRFFAFPVQDRAYSATVTRD
jgi:D-alanyl-D-alanine dipeptidase